MFEIVMYIGIFLMVVGEIYTLVLSRNVPCDGCELPVRAKAGMIVFIVGVVMAVVGGFVSSDFGVAVFGTISC